MTGVQTCALPISPIGISKEFKVHYVFDAGIPVKSINNVKPEGRVKIMKSYSGKVAKGVYTGSYDGLDAAYARLMNYMKMKKLEPNGYPWEEYISDPMNTPKEKMITNLFFPVK